MKIGIDARFLTHPQVGGFKTYTENLITALAGIDQENEYFLYLDRAPSAGNLVPLQKNFQPRIVTGSLPMLGLPWREQIRLPQQAAADRLDLFHSPCLTAPLFLKCPLVITVHDMIWAFPERFSERNARSVKRKFMEWYNYSVPKLATRYASAVITVSNAARQSIIEYLQYPSSKLHVTWEAAQKFYGRVDDTKYLDAVRGKYGLHSKFILAIGSADPRKNMSTLVQAYSSLSGEIQQEHQLAIVWTHPLLADRLSRQVGELGLEGKVKFLQDVTNEDLLHLYNSASLFVFPSLYEGFGLPLLEAMACGTPIIAANTSSIPEIAGDAALLFDPTDAQGIAEIIAYVLVNDHVRLDLVQKGFKRNGMFSWEKCAHQTLSVYENVFRHNR